MYYHDLSGEAYTGISGEVYSQHFVYPPDGGNLNSVVPYKKTVYDVLIEKIAEIHTRYGITSPNEAIKVKELL